MFNLNKKTIIQNSKTCFVILGFFAISMLVSFNGEQFHIKSVLSQKNLNENNIEYNFELIGDKDSIKFDAVILTDPIKISNTGVNSSNSRIYFNPSTQKVTISWLDILPLPKDSTIYFTIGNSSISWSEQKSIETVNEVLDFGFTPIVDKNNTIHFVFPEFDIDNYELQDIMVEDESTILPKNQLTNDSGNSTLPSIISDSNGTIHLVWRDTTSNSDGDLLYSYYNATTDLWDTPYTSITSGEEIVPTSKTAITIDENDTLHLVWGDKNSGDQELFYSYLEVNGLWSSPEKITNIGYNPINPEISFNNFSKEIEILFRDNGSTSNLYYITGPSKGIASEWSSPITLTNYLSDESEYSLSSDNNGNTIAVYENYISGQNRVFYKQKNTLNTWETSQLISLTSTNAYDPSITFDNKGQYYIAYSQVVNQAAEIYVLNGFIDTDADGLSDNEEINVYGTNPNNQDSDGDSLLDGDEVLVYFTDPLDQDSDNDQMPDDFEVEYNFDPNDNQDAEMDNDEDDLTNLEEYQENTNPLIQDTDGDTLTDGEEVNDHQTDPLLVDTDGDSLSDGYEVRWGLNPLIEDDIKTDPDGDGLTTEFESFIWTNPNDPDTDNDGYSDGVEVNNGTNPLDPNDFPTNLSTPQDYSRLLTIIFVSVGSIALAALLAILVAQQFRPSKPGKRKELEREQSHLLKTEEDKGRTMSWERKEKASFGKQKKSLDEIVDKVDELTAKESEVIAKDEVTTPQIKEPTVIFDQKVLEEKQQKLKQVIIELKEYEKQLEDILKKKMTPYNLSTSSREGLTEFATDSQRIYSEAKTYWNNTILPLIKGYEESLYLDTLEAERIIDNCENTANKILEILVKREMEFTEDEERKASVKEIARKALEESKNQNEENPSEIGSDEKN